MGTSENIAAEAPRRRVGTLTFGGTLVVAGALMAASLFWPQTDFSWALKASPAVLICLGIEILLAARGGDKIKYDWVGMLLCFLLTGAALCMYAAAWYLTNWTDVGYRYDASTVWEVGGCYEGSRSGDESSLTLDYSEFDGREFQLLTLEAGDVLQWEIVNDRGSVDVDIIEAVDRETIFTGDGLPSGSYSVEAPRDGAYEVWVTGRQATGSAHFRREE